ncbi:hypothetical protein RRG08_019178 [Elysia crispata]|uniref:Uncharacterized protein n=1 Tax=Elysia crispata TaxID=231223 RepID=A0AAE0ZW13_9GAST|nr:hypothetical protein RRG08_019178 [Elysia crispata]
MSDPQDWIRESPLVALLRRNQINAAANRKGQGKRWKEWLSVELRIALVCLELTLPSVSRIETRTTVMSVRHANGLTTC